MPQECCRVVVLDPNYASSIGHHQPLNQALLEQLTSAGWQPEIWADEQAPSGPCVRRVSHGCGYIDPRHWVDLGGARHLAAQLNAQLQAALEQDQSCGLASPQAWLVHSVLPYQLIALAQVLQAQPAAQVVISLMYGPRESLGGIEHWSQERLASSCIETTRVALQALALACRRAGHQLVVGCASVQQQTSYAPLLQRARLAPPLLHPAVVGAGPQPVGEANPQAQEMVLLHWGDNKPDKGLEEALSLLEAILQCPAAERPQWPLLFHCHASQGLSGEHSSLLDEAQRQLGQQLIVLSEQVSDRTMQQLLGQCSLALMAYNPITYAERSSGVFWCYAAARYGQGKAAHGVGYGNHWLQREAEALGMAWSSLPHLGYGHKPSGAQWLEAINAMRNGARECHTQWQPEAGQILGQSFAQWAARQLSRGGA